MKEESKEILKEKIRALKGELEKINGDQGKGEVIEEKEDEKIPEFVDDYKPYLTKKDLKEMKIVDLADGIIWHTGYLQGISELMSHAREDEVIVDKNLTRVFFEMGERLNLIEAMGNEFFNRTKSV